MASTGIEQPLRPTSPGDELAFEVRDRPENVAVARRTIGQFLERFGVSRPLVDEVQLVASELVTNAIQHGRSGSIGVGLRVRRGVEIVLDVTSPGSVHALPPVESWQPAGGLAPNGRGLGIVRILSDDVELSGDDDHVVVTCHRRWLSQEVAR